MQSRGKHEDGVILGSAAQDECRVEGVEFTDQLDRIWSDGSDRQ